MKIVLLSGGSGQRLWPMSNSSRSKQFLKVLPGENGERISMLQSVWGSINKLGFGENTYICASRAQHDSIIAQVGNNTPFIEEPNRRDTFPAIALATLYLLDETNCSIDEPIVVMPVDQHVDQHYFTTVATLPEYLVSSRADLALLGVTPTEPNSKFGYISVTEDATATYRHVSSFVEKPETTLAKQLIHDGALWNCGVFCFRPSLIVNRLRDLDLPISYSGLRAAFDTLPARSFDYEVVENTSSIISVPYTGTWDDLGTWPALTNYMTDSVAGIAASEKCEGTHLINELGIPLVAIGLKETIVVASPDGILVGDRSQASEIKNLVAPFSGRPMFEERFWGHYRVMDYQKLDDGSEVVTRWVELKAGYSLTYQKHFNRSETWTIVSGYGLVVLDDRIFEVSIGDTVKVHAEQWHAIKATSSIRLVEVQRGNEVSTEDMVRRDFDWDSILLNPSS